MRFFIVSNEVPKVAGTIAAPTEESYEDGAIREADAKFLRELGFVAGAAAVGPWAAVLFGSLGATEFNRRRKEILRDLFRRGREVGRSRMAAIASAAERSVFGHGLLEGLPVDELKHPFEDHCLTVRASLNAYRPEFDAAIFQGAFAKAEELTAIAGAEGGNSRIHVFNTGVARQLFRRHGGGVLEDNVYVLHPKREDVLVPFRTFHSEMLQEMAREVRVVLGRIGARRLVLETVEGVTFGGKVVTPLPAKTVGAKVDASEREERRLVYEWASPTFEPEAALTDCVWIRDNAGAMTIVDQRRTSNLARFEEFSRVDTSFRVNVSVMKVFKSDFSWASESQYRYEVEFFPR